MLLLPGLAGLICVAAILSTLHVWFGLLKKLHFGRVGFETIRARGVKVFITAVFLLYPTICSKVFRVFNPHTNGDRTYLRDDLSLEFLVDERHKRLYVFVVIFCTLYVIGIPLVTYLVLRRHQAQIRAGKQSRIVHYEFGQLYKMYEPEY